MTTDDLSGLVPEIYYDLIARVSAGVCVLVMMVSPTWDQIGKFANLTAFIALLGFGYVVGHLLTTVSFFVNAFLWNPISLWGAKKVVRLNYSFKSNSARDVFDKIYTRIDWVAKKDKSGGAILKKMEAGAALTDSLFSGWLVLWACSYFFGGVGWGIGFGDKKIIGVVTVLLGVSVLIRRFLLVVREDRILRLLDYDPNSLEEPR